MDNMNSNQKSPDKFPNRLEGNFKVSINLCQFASTITVCQSGAKKKHPMIKKKEIALMHINKPKSFFIKCIRNSDSRQFTGNGVFFIWFIEQWISFYRSCSVNLESACDCISQGFL